MKPETWIAIYAAIVATSALLLNFRSWYESGVRLNLSLMPDARLIGTSKENDEDRLMALTVVNRGGELTTLTHMVVLRYDNAWKRWRNKPSSSYIIPNPQIGGTGTIPYELDAGRKWLGIGRRRKDVMPDLEDGKHFIGVFASNRDKPYLVRIPVPKDKLPVGTKAI